MTDPEREESHDFSRVEDVNTWAELFERAAAYDVEGEAIREALERQREDESDGGEAGDD